MVYEPWNPIEKTSAQHIPITEVQGWPDIQRKPVPSTFEPDDSLVRRAKQPRRNGPLDSSQPAEYFLCGCARRKSLVLVNPKIDAPLVRILLPHFTGKHSRPAMHMEPEVDEFAAVHRCRAITK